jgi:hypothetical protein
VLIMTPSRGLATPEARIGLDQLNEFSTVDVAATEPRFTEPLRESARKLAESECQVVLLGSIATGKYVEALLPVFRESLLFPREFVGRGDMSRGGLLLRCATLGNELGYLPVQGAVRKGRRAPRIATM